MPAIPIVEGMLDGDIGAIFCGLVPFFPCGLVDHTRLHTPRQNVEEPRRAEKSEPISIGKSRPRKRKNRPNRTRRRGAHDTKPRQPPPCAAVGLPNSRSEFAPKEWPRV